MNHGFSFEIKRGVCAPYSPMSEEEIFEKLERSRRDAAQGKYRSAETVVSEMREKYELT